MSDLLVAQIESLQAQVLAIRDVVARLVAYEASRHENPDDLLRDVSEAGDARIDRDTPPNESQMRMREIMRAQIDWMVAAARGLIGR